MVTSSKYPYLDIVITIGTWSFVEEVYLDTGFDGGLLIPSYLRHEIPAKPIAIQLRVADDESVLAPAWSGTVEIAERQYPAEIAALGSRFLLGREVLDRLLVCFDRGREVRIEV